MATATSNGRMGPHLHQVLSSPSLSLTFVRADLMHSSNASVSRKDKLMECGNGIDGIDSQRHVFSAVVACLSGFRGQERSRIYDHIIRGGGTVTTLLTQSCTHLITSELRGAKCHTAMSLPNIKIVSALWFKRSVSNGRKEEEDSYDARAPLNDLISALPNDILLDILHTHGKQVQYVNQCILSATACRHVWWRAT